MGTRPRGMLGPVVLAGLPGSARLGAARLAWGCPAAAWLSPGVGQRARRGERAGGGSSLLKQIHSFSSQGEDNGRTTVRNSILDQFINSHEQSREEFLNTFTYLLKEKEGKTIQGNKVDSLRKIFSTSELSKRNEQNGSPERSEKMWVSLPSQMPNENEQVDKYLDCEDIDSDEETCRGGSLVLPGEVEQTVTCCTPVFDKPIQLKFRTLSVPQPLDSKPQELLGDDVQPFSLDEEFDYDNVAVTPKFSEAELKAIKEKKTGSA